MSLFICCCCGRKVPVPLSQKIDFRFQRRVFSLWSFNTPFQPFMYSWNYYSAFLCISFIRTILMSSMSSKWNFNVCVGVFVSAGPEPAHQPMLHADQQHRITPCGQPLLHLAHRHVGSGGHKGVRLRLGHQPHLHAGEPRQRNHR